jgi:pSer/pThr/pTyr-binding forkhead associated (FHA) protein/S1-C subfamily serine protease
MKNEPPRPGSKFLIAGRAGIVFLAFWFATGLTGSIGQALAEENAVLQAAKSVYRLWSAVEIDETLDEFDGEVRQALLSNGYVQLEVEDELVAIFMYNTRPHALIGHGSGYVVSEDNHLVTLDHVLNPQSHDSELVDTTFLTFLLLDLKPHLRLVPVRVLWSDAGTDLAVARVDGLDAAPLVLADPASVAPTQQVYSIGFPGASDQLAAGRGLGDPEGYLQPKLAEGTIKGTYRSGLGTKVWEHHAPISGGNSGGPLVNACGEVVGTNFAGHVEVQNALLAVALEELIPELDRLGVAFQQSNTACRVAAGGLNMFRPSALITLAGLFLLGSGLFWLYQRRQAKPAYSHDQQGMHIPQPGGADMADKVHEVDETSKDNWKTDDHGRQYRYDTIVGVIFKDQQMAGPLPKSGADHALGRAAGPAAGVPVGPAPAPSLSTVTLTSLNGLPDIVLTQGDPVVIGRDPRKAQIVLDNPKISGQHVLVRYDGRQLLVEDLQSTNGTFLSGQRMNKPKAMNRGDVLHLSSAPEGVGYVIKGAKPGPVATLVPLDPRLPTIALMSGQRIAVGRGPDNNVIIDDPHLSALHCHMQAQADGTVVVEDSRTTNGTFVDSIENRIDTATLKPGQKLCLGVKDVVYELKAGKE